MYDTAKIKKLCSSFTVLLVDDEEAARLQVFNILKLFFSQVYMAKDGVEALEVYKDKKPDLIITDLTMPKMCGLELVDAIRKIDQLQSIIVMSAHTETDIIVKAIKSGLDGYILKPIEAVQMFEAIEKAAVFLQMRNESIKYQKSLEHKVDEQEKLLIEQLVFDKITGLQNKEKLQVDFKTTPFTEIILLNIDNFSQVNSTYGYNIGDKLLQQIATFLESIVGDSLYKGNGDEFFIALENLNIQEVMDLAEDIKEKIYNKRFEVESSFVRITFSMGIVSIDATETEIPYSKAQLAISDVRKLHKNIIGYYNADSKTENHHQKMHEWAQKTKLALDFDLLVPYYQPIVNVSTGKVEKYECLARIVEQEEPISPIFFIEPSRIAGMVTDITRRMIFKAFRTFSGTDIEFSINITDDDLKEEYLVEYLVQACKEHKINPHKVVLEVLENISDYDAGHAINQMDALKTLGFQIAIDDFGAESSNFARVQKLDVDYIKIDGAFIKDIVYNRNSLIIVKTIVYYAKNSNLKTIAEFVYNEETYDIVKELGVDYVQGYYFSEPLKEIV